MRAVVYSEHGEAGVLRLVERPLRDPGAGEVRVRVAVSGVNPTDWKSRLGAGSGSTEHAEMVPNQDGAGVIDATGSGVEPGRVGERVWIWEAAWRRADGTAQEFVNLPSAQAVALPAAASFEQGASLGIPALTAHRCLTVAAGLERLEPGALAAKRVLVAGGAGAVGHAAIQLARWSGAQVVASVSSDAKATLARAAGAHEVVDYTLPEPAARIREASDGGVDLIVEVAPSANAMLDADVLRAGGSIVAYASGSDPFVVPLRALMTLNANYHFVLVYTVPAEAKRRAVEDVSAALAAGALPVGERAGLPLLSFTLAETAAAHEAVAGNAVGKVLITVRADDEEPSPPDELG